MFDHQEMPRVYGTGVVAPPLCVSSHTSGENGRWYSDTRTISLRKDLHPTLRYCTLAHKLGHALNNHDSRAETWLRGRQEREADIFAANVLIDPSEYKSTELLYGPHPGAIAHELGVTVHLIKVWAAHHTPQRITP